MKSFLGIAVFCLAAFAVHAQFPVPYQSREGKWGFAKATQEVVIPAKYDAAYYFDDEGLAIVGLNNKYGYVDKTGKEVIALQYETAAPFYNGAACVGINKKLGYIDPAGKVIISLQYDNADKFIDGLAMVSLRNKWGYINKSGKEIVPIKYDGADIFMDGLARVKQEIKSTSALGKNPSAAAVKRAYKYGFVNKQGHEIIPLQYDEASVFYGEYATVVQQDKWGIIDTLNHIIIPIKYDNILFSGGGFVIVLLDKKYGYVDIKTGAEVIPPKYDWVYDFYDEPIACVKLANKYGFIDKTGKEVIPLQYDDATTFSNGKAWVKKDGREYYIDQTGKELQ